MIWTDRQEAGRELGAALAKLALSRPFVLGLTRGGVVVAYQVALALAVPLDVVIARKLGAPRNPEYAIGGIAESSPPVLNEVALLDFGINGAYLEAEIARQRGLIHSARKLYRSGRPLPDLTGYAAILVDDGLATGYTMLAAVAAVRRVNPSMLVVAVPVAPQSTLASVARVADQAFSLQTPQDFVAVGTYYQQFPEVTTENLLEILSEPEN